MTSANIKHKNTFLNWRFSIAIGVVLSAGLNATASYDVTTIAGVAGSFAHTDGVGSAARFKSPGMMSIALSTGDLFIADTDDSVRKVTTAGGTYTASTLLSYQWLTAAIPTGGNGILAMDELYRLTTWINSGGIYVNTNATFIWTPGVSFAPLKGLVMDSTGNIFVSDTSVNEIIKILPNGSYSVFVQNSALNGLTGITIDSSNNLYVSATSNNTICKITPAGVITTIAGTAGSSGSTDAVGSAARFNSPIDIDIDAAGNLYVADRGNNLIRKLTNNSGTYTASTIAGTAGSSGSADGIGAAARFNAPTGLAVDASGNIFVTDTGNNTIRKLSSKLTISGTATGTAYITGGGTAVLPPSNSISAVEVSNGILQISSSAVPVTFNASGGAATLSITSAVALGPLTFTSAGNVQIGSSITATIASPPVGSGTMTLTGGGILQAQVDLSSSTTPIAVSEGILEVSGSGRLPNAATSVASGAILQLGTSGGTVASGAVANASVASGGIMSILAGATGAVTTATIASGGVLSVAAGVTAPSGMFTSATFRSGGILQVADGATLGQSFTSVA
jgi:hypothetical protein